MRNESDRPPKTGNLTSVRNALRVLELLREGDALRVTQVSEALKIGKSTAYRLLSTLQEAGFVRRDRTGHLYRAGQVLYDIGLSAVGDLEVRRRARRPMETLSGTTGETVNLLMLEGDHVRVIDGVEGARVLHVRPRIGQLLPANVAAGGKAILAEMPAAEIRTRFPDGLLASPTNSATPSWDRFEAELARVRQRGYAANLSETEAGMHALAVAVHDRQGRPLAAVSMTGPGGRLPVSRLPEFAPLVARTAHDVSLAMAS